MAFLAATTLCLSLVWSGVGAGQVSGAHLRAPKGSVGHLVVGALAVGALPLGAGSFIPTRDGGFLGLNGNGGYSRRLPVCIELGSIHSWADDLRAGSHGDKLETEKAETAPNSKLGTQIVLTVP